MGNFTFFHNVFYAICILNFFSPFQNKPWLLRVCSTNPLKTLQEKGKLHVTSNFSFSHSVFYLFGDLTAIFVKLEIVFCKLSVWKSLKLVIWERVNSHISVVVCSCFEFGTFLEWCIRKWVKLSSNDYRSMNFTLSNNKRNHEVQCYLHQA